MGLAIRLLGIGDAAALAELQDAVTPGWVDALDPGASGPIAFVADGDSFVYGAWRDDAALGWLWGVHARRPDGRVMTYVHEIEVIESARRQGVATLMLEAALGLARQRGSHKLWLMTRPGNEQGNGLYSSLVGENESMRTWTWDLT